jgi:hypothetical protein
MRKILLSRAGQMTIEMMLIAVLMTGVAISISKYARSSGFMASLVEGPWTRIQGMIEDGVWMPSAQSKSFHPNLKKRHASEKGDPA